MTGKCGLCGSEYDLQERVVRYRNGDRQHNYTFFRARCNGCGATVNWMQNEKAARARIEDGEALTKASHQWPVVCPFFVDSTGLDVLCEGISAGVKVMDVRFSSATDKARHMGRYCKGCWEKCEIARCCERKYGG